MNDIEVSIIIPYHNDQSTILKAVESVISQNICRYEIIIIDDNSFEKLIIPNIISNCINIKTIRLDTNHGPAFARNIGLSIAKGKWIQFLDADDWLLPNKIQHQLNVSKGNDIIFSDWLIIKNDKATIKKKCNIKSGLLNPYEFLEVNPFVIHSPLLRSSTLDPNIIFDNNIAHEDWEFWIHLSIKKLRAKYLPGIYCIYNNREGSRSFSLEKNLVNRIDCLNAIKKKGYNHKGFLNKDINISIQNTACRLVKLYNKNKQFESCSNFLKMYKIEFNAMEKFEIHLMKNSIFANLDGFIPGPKKLKRLIAKFFH